MRSKKSPTDITQVEEKSPPLEKSASSEDRAVRLARLKLAIKNGTYKISAEDVADKVINRLLNASAKP